jgi:hypothetical protein
VSSSAIAAIAGANLRGIDVSPFPSAAIVYHTPFSAGRFSVVTTPQGARVTAAKCPAENGSHGPVMVVRWMNAWT